MKTTVSFTGDICFSHYFRTIQENVLASDVSDFIKESDYCIGNIEGGVFSFTGSNERQFAHHSDTKVAELLATYGINVWNLANNHIFDFGDDGVSETIINCSNNGCRNLGLQSPESDDRSIVLDDSYNVGIVSVTYTDSSMNSYSGKYNYLDWNDYTAISERIKNIKDVCRWCVLVVHGGDEFSHIPMPDTRNRYLKYLNLGADIVIGHHPHVVQNYECFDGKLVFYSLGNFIFDTDYERVQKRTDVGEIVRIDFYDNFYTWKSMTTRIDRIAHLVVAAETPPVFTDLSTALYNELWPFAARELSSSDKKTLQYLNPTKYKDANSIQWMIRDLRLFRHKEYRKQIIGKYYSYINKRPKSPIIDYIIG